MNGQNSKNQSKSFITFNLGNQPYAIDTGVIIEIKDFSQLEIYPNPGPPYLLGLCYFNDTMVPVIDLCRLLKQEPDNKIPYFSIIVIELDLDFVAFKIPGLPNIQSFQADKISKPSADNNKVSPFIKNVIQHSPAMISIIDTPTLAQDISLHPFMLSNHNPEISK